MQTEAMVMMATGGPEVLERKTIELFEPGPREVRIRVRAVALNHIDIWGRRGLPHFRYEFPHRLGADISGEVEALGPGAKGANVGDHVVVNPGLSCGSCESCLSGSDVLCRHYRILGENTQGGYSRHVVVPDANLLPKPRALSFEDAAALPLCFLTAWNMVVKKGAIQAGHTVLVQAAGSGVSSAAIQIAKMHGARVFATTSTDEKAKRAKELGADEVINYTTQDFVAECKRLTGKRGVDLVVEHVGGEVLAKSIVAATAGGRVVTCGATAGFTPQIDLRHVFFRQVQVLGSTMGSKGDLFGILRHVEAGKLRPVVDRVMPLWDAVEAHRLLEARKAFGKIVLAVD
ncbi:MAG: zinc-binding dehydrogenase [Labilithrix sp.]|nr:zinc-binding dehydrogenase [Labilithrix sp.]MCW5812288.1 zinc-binding dehydrogenase [Labilithrix sp.]